MSGLEKLTGNNSAVMNIINLAAVVYFVASAYSQNWEPNPGYDVHKYGQLVGHYLFMVGGALGAWTIVQNVLKGA